MAKQEKTNVMRLLDAEHISYTPHQYPHSGNDAVEGKQVADLLGQPHEQVFKTLVTKCHSGACAVFVVPVDHELDLKKAATAIHEKSVDMISVKDLLKITGYIRGGCSPLGMKKPFKTVIHASALQCQTMMVSAGKVGYQVELTPGDLIQLSNAITADIIR